MKYKKDVPRKYQKYVKWVLVWRDGEEFPEPAHAGWRTLYNKKPKPADPQDYKALPVLCLPLDLLHVQGEPGHAELFTAPLVYDKPKENA